MKNLKPFFATLVVAILFPCIQLAARERIPTEGEWHEKGNRSVTIMPPTAFIDGNIVSLEFVAAIPDLQLVITDADGIIYYQEVIYAEVGDYEIPYEIPEGEYTLLISYSRGYLKGSFTVE